MAERKTVASKYTEYIFLWEIEKYTVQRCCWNKILQLQCCASKAYGQQLYWHLLYYPKGDLSRRINCKSKYIGLALNVLKPFPEKVENVSVRIILINGRGKRFQERLIFTTISRTHNIYRFYFEKKSIFLSQFSSDNVLLVECHVKIETNIDATPHRLTSSEVVEMTYENLTTSLYRFYLNEDHSRVTLCADDTKFYVNEHLLRYHSSEFTSMLNSQYRPVGKIVLNISDINEDIMRTILQYMYGVKMNVDSVSHMQSVFIAAAKYGMTGLKDWCDEELAKALNETNLNQQNLYSLLEFALRNNAYRLRGAAVMLLPEFRYIRD